ncbi:hypothetical protein, partial [Erwinia sp. PsM31]|uniref:hypothetical protein n=1 Tax=Erwinia sp. PsM31 TaxID=3030535 RepID=UPI00263B175E
TADLLHAMQALSQLSYTPEPKNLCRLDGGHNMKRGRTCQRQNANLCSIAEKAAKAMQKAASAPFATQHNPP